MAHAPQFKTATQSGTGASEESAHDNERVPVYDDFFMNARPGSSGDHGALEQ